MSFIVNAETFRTNGPFVEKEDFTLSPSYLLFLKSHRHTQIVRFLRRATPALGLILIIHYFYSLFHSSGVGLTLPKINMPQITSKDLAMQNPTYEGVTKDGGTYLVTAKFARQDFSNMNFIKLEGITGELRQPNKLKTYLSAVRGTFDQKANILQLEEKIDITTDDGMKAQLKSATVKTKEGIITSSEPVLATFPAGTIQSQELVVFQKEHKISFVRDVICDLKPNAKTEIEGNLQEKKTSFGTSHAPLKITSSQLDLADDLKTATFTGDVKAHQAEDTLLAPTLIVLYENNPKDGTTPKEGQNSSTNAQRTDIKKIDVEGPFLITRGQKEKVTGNTASFETKEQIAHLEGNIEISSLPDKHVSADRAELNQKDDTALLRGNVSVLNGETLLKGQHLWVERKKGYTSLTSPSLEGRPAGRITAHFVRKNSSHVKTVANPIQPNRSSSNFDVKDFNTDPNAPVDIKATRLDVDDQQKTAIFKGNVEVKQGGVLMTSPTLKAYYSGSANLADLEKTKPSAANKSPSELTRMEATESVVVTLEDGRKVKGDWATFDTLSNTTVIGGEVELIQQSSIIRGSRLTIDMITNKTTIDTASSQTLAPPPLPSWSPRTELGQKTRANRPSAIFFPNELKVGKDEKNGSQPKSGPSSDWTSVARPQ